MDYTQKNSSALVQANQMVGNAYIDLSQSNAPQLIRKVTLDLSEGRTDGNPFKVSFAYKALYVQDASDSNTIINWTAFNSGNNDKMPLAKNGVLNFDLPVFKAGFTWEAQPNKSITLIFILNGSFRPGSLFTEVASAVEGNALTVSNPVNISVPTLIAGEDLNRTVLRVNASDNIEIASNVAGPYFPIGTNIVLRNTGEVWARPVSSNATVQTLEES